MRHREKDADEQCIPSEWDHLSHTGLDASVPLQQYTDRSRTKRADVNTSTAMHNSRCAHSSVQACISPDKSCMTKWDMVCMHFMNFTLYNLQRGEPHSCYSLSQTSIYCASNQLQAYASTCRFQGYSSREIQKQKWTLCLCLHSEMSHSSKPCGPPAMSYSCALLPTTSELLQRHRHDTDLYIPTKKCHMRKQCSVSRFQHTVTR